MDNIYAFREAYDNLRGMEPDRDYRGKATVTTSIREDGTKSTRVSSLDDDVWEKELAKELVFPDGLSVSMEELAMHCLWKITFYGFLAAPSRAVMWSFCWALTMVCGMTITQSAAEQTGAWITSLSP